LIIDVHAHYTTAPGELWAYRAAQFTSLNRPVPRPLKISQETIEASLQGQLAQTAARGIDALCFSPQASAMGHDLGDARVSRYWTEVNNDLIAEVCGLHPEVFVPVCQLPQSPGADLTASVQELRRCVEGLGFVGCNINPDVSGGEAPFTPSLGDEYWYPLWEAMVELDVPGMIHASSTRNPALHVNGSHYVMQDYAAVVALCSSRVFTDFPTLRLIIPHGGGAIPYQLNRQRALHVLEGLPDFEESLRHLYFDTSLYDADSMEMLIRKIGPDRVLFGSEMFGTAKSVDERTGRHFDDNREMVTGIPWLNEEQQAAVLGGNARTVFPRASFAAARTASLT
jgi:4-oxalmesaconate hydratase